MIKLDVADATVLKCKKSSIIMDKKMRELRIECEYSI